MAGNTRYTLHELLKYLITSIEDISAENLLAAPAWARDLAPRFAMERFREEIEAPLKIDPWEECTSMWPIDHVERSNTQRLAAKAWLQGRLAADEMTQSIHNMTAHKFLA